eukprot:g4640.t1
MKIRTITTFVSINSEFNVKQITAACEFLNKQQKFFSENTDYEVQTIRLVFNNPEEWLVDDKDEIKRDLLTLLNDLLVKYNIGFCSLGRLPTRLSHLAPQIIFSGSKFNCSVDVQRADVPGALNVAKACEEIARKTEGGLGNFRFCASLNFANDSCCPFFPGSFAPSVGDSKNSDEKIQMYFSIGLENGVDFQIACKKAKTISNLGQCILNEFTPGLSEIQKYCIEMEQKNDSSALQFIYAGIDSSLNPALGKDGSIAYGFNMLDEIENFGKSGASLAAVAEATMAVQNDLKNKSNIKLCGYCGCMLPLCEDEGLAKSNLNARDLLTLSSTCGVGIDTLPLGLQDLDISKLAYLYLDACAVAIRKNRPLSVRVFPVPGCSSGDVTKFDSPYLTNSICRSVK